jgi:hypothetical protein
LISAKRYCQNIWILTSAFEKEDLPGRIQLQGLLYVAQTAEPASNDDVIELSVFWDNQRMNPTDRLYGLILPEITCQVSSSMKQFLLMADVPVGDCFPGTGCPPLWAGSFEMTETT